MWHVCRYRGHVSLKTIKDVSFVGPRQEMVAAGSDDGRMFIWDRYTGGRQQLQYMLLEQWSQGIGAAVSGLSTMAGLIK